MRGAWRWSLGRGMSHKGLGGEVEGALLFGCFYASPHFVSLV